jgi:REP element-mobilizing transposase RayT
MVTFPTDYVVMMAKYHGKILVGDDRRSTGIIHETCEEVNIGIINRYVQAPYLSPG